MRLYEDSQRQQQARKISTGDSYENMSDDDRDIDIDSDVSLYSCAKYDNNHKNGAELFSFLQDGEDSDNTKQSRNAAGGQIYSQVSKFRTGLLA